MKSKVYRPWVQVPILVVCFGTFLLIGVLSLFGDTMVADGDIASIIIYVCVTATGLYGLWRSSRLGIRVGPDGLQVRGMGRDRLVPWSDVADVTAGETDSRFNVPIYAPILTLVGSEQPMPIRPMGSYRRRDAELRAELLREYLAKARAT